MKRVGAVALLIVAALFAVGLWPRFSSHVGYATPFGLPDTIHVHGRDYIDPSGCVAVESRDRPLRRIGSVPGFLTGSKPILLPHSMPRGLTPTVLFVRAGCVRAYGLSGGP